MVLLIAQMRRERDPRSDHQKGLRRDLPPLQRQQRAAVPASISGGVGALQPVAVAPLGLSCSGHSGEHIGASLARPVDTLAGTAGHAGASASIGACLGCRLLSSLPLELSQLPGTPHGQLIAQPCHEAPRSRRGLCAVCKAVVAPTVALSSRLVRVDYARVDEQPSSEPSLGL